MAPSETAALPQTPAAPATPTTRSRSDGRLGRGLLIAAGVVGMLGLILLTGTVSQQGGALDASQRQGAEVTVQRDDLARAAQDEAVTTSALCATGGDVAVALDAAGQCERARDRLRDPVVASQAPTLTPQQISDIVARVTALVAPGATVDDVAAQVLARIAGDPALRGLDEQAVRNIVAAAIAAMPPVRDGVDGASFGGFFFERRDGQCVAVITTIESDGSRTQDVQPAGDGACPPDDPPPPTDSPDPTTDPPVPTQPPATTPPATETPAPIETPAPSSAPPAPDPDDGLLNIG